MTPASRAAAIALLAVAATVALPAHHWLSQRQAPAEAGRTGVLEQHLRRTPSDARGWVILAREHMQADRFGAAAEAYGKAIAASPRVARDAQVWCELADALGMAQGNRLAGEPRRVIERALALQPDHPCALEMAGSAALEAGERRLAIGYWERLLAQLEPGTPRHAELATAIARGR